MVRVLPDSEIAALVQEPKPLPADWRRRLIPRRKQGNRFGEFAIDVPGAGGHAFRLLARQNHPGLLDFSVILLFVEEDGHEYILVRNNGRHSSRHSNRWEKAHGLPGAVVEIGPHRHVATERYQANGLPIDSYAEPSDDYHDFPSAVDDMLEKCGFERPFADNPQMSFGDAL